MAASIGTTTATSPSQSECPTSPGSPDPEEANYDYSHIQSGINDEGTDKVSDFDLHFSDDMIIARKDVVDYITDRGNAPYDTVVYCLDGSHPIPVHGRVLSMFCPYFFQIFTSQRSFAYGLAKSYLLDIDGGICCKIIHYLYYGHIYICSGNAFSLVKIGRTLGLWNLVNKCEEFFSRCVKKENCHFLLMHAKLNRMNYMESDIKLFMKRHGIIDTTEPPSTNGPNQNLKEFTYDQIMQFLSYRPAPMNDEEEKWAFTKILDWVKMDNSNRSKYLKYLIATIDLSRLPSQLIEMILAHFRMNPLLIADRECQEMYTRAVESLIHKYEEERMRLDEYYAYRQMNHQRMADANINSICALLSDPHSGDELDVVNVHYDSEVCSSATGYRVDEQLSSANSTSHNHNTRRKFLSSGSGHRLLDHMDRRIEEVKSDTAFVEEPVLQQPVNVLPAISCKSFAILKPKIRKAKAKTRKKRVPVSQLVPIEQFEVFNDVPALPLMVFSTGTKARKNIFYAYNFQSQQCQILTETLSRRFQSSFTIIGNVILDIGGHSPQGSSTKIELFDTTGVIVPGNVVHYGWKTGPHMKIPRTDFALVTHNGFIYVLGGVNILISLAPLNHVERLEVSPDGRKLSRWQLMAPMLEGRRSFGAAVFNEHIFVVGGIGDDLEDLSTASKYDAENNTWVTVASMSQARKNVRVAVVYNRLYAVGGCFGVQNIPLKSCEIYDPGTDQWTFCVEMAVPRNIPGVVSHGGRVYAFGGNKEQFCAERYDPLTNIWELFKIPEAMRSVNFHCVALYNHL